MTQMTDQEENLGARLRRITLAAREARRLEEEKVFVGHCETLVARFCDSAEEAAGKCEDHVDVDARFPVQDAAKARRIAERVVARLCEMGVQARLSADFPLEEYTDLLRICMRWDVEPEEPAPETSAASPVIAPPRILKYPCEECAVKHNGPDAVDETTCFCKCHIGDSLHAPPTSP